jgi:adenosylhomocysteinase
VAACLHVTAETANLLLALAAGGAQVALCSANPLSAQDDVAAALVADEGIQVRATRGEDPETSARRLEATLELGPQVTIDDGADLLITAHRQGTGVERLIGGTEETTTGLVRLRRLEQEGGLRCPILAVNEARTERALNDRHGTGQSALDGIIRASHVLLAGHTVVVLGYGWAGQGIAERARGAGAAVVVCEIDPMRALEARMAGYDVMPALAAAKRGDVFITVTGSRGVLGREHFARMKDGALLANAGHFDVEIDLEALRALATRVHRVLPLVEQYEREDGTRLNLLADGRVVNLAAAEGHPAALMDVSFSLQALCVEELVKRGPEMSPGVHEVPPRIDQEIARLKLGALGVGIDESTPEQEHYRQSWG